MLWSDGKIWGTRFLLFRFRPRQHVWAIAFLCRSFIVVVVPVIFWVVVDKRFLKNNHFCMKSDDAFNFRPNLSSTIWCSRSRFKSVVFLHWNIMPKNPSISIAGERTPICFLDLVGQGLNDETKTQSYFTHKWCQNDFVYYSGDLDRFWLPADYLLRRDLHGIALHHIEYSTSFHLMSDPIAWNHLLVIPRECALLHCALATCRAGRIATRYDLHQKADALRFRVHVATLCGSFKGASSERNAFRDLRGESPV